MQLQGRAFREAFTWLQDLPLDVPLSWSASFKKRMTVRRRIRHVRTEQVTLQTIESTEGPLTYRVSSDQLEYTCPESA